MKITTILGTRPEIIRLSALVAKLDKFTDHRLVHTGQNDHPNLSEIMFSDLGLRLPDNVLGISNQSPGAAIGQTLTRIEEEFIQHRPDAVVVLGDTNSGFAAISAERMGIPVYHLEAGNRSFDFNVPEELNRKIIDHASSFNLAYTRRAYENLMREGLSPRFCSISGSPMMEVLKNLEGKIADSAVLPRLGLEPGKYFLASLHRQENVDDAETLKNLLNALGEVQSIWNIPVLLTVHPRTRKRIAAFSAKTDGIRLCEPFGIADYSRLQVDAQCVISDSGSLPEEAAILNFKGVICRSSMERQEVYDYGVSFMSGLEPKKIVETIHLATSLPARTNFPLEYQVDDFSDRVLSFIMSTYHLHSKWQGRKSFAD